jgi:hypothetical protein
MASTTTISSVVAAATDSIVIVHTRQGRKVQILLLITYYLTSHAE